MSRVLPALSPPVCASLSLSVFQLPVRGLLALSASVLRCLCHCHWQLVLSAPVRGLFRWACHFTSTANLTACATAGGERWVTLVKNPTDPSEFTAGLGFIAAGNDVKPPANVTVAACKSVCSTTPVCKAVTFMESVADANQTDTMVKCYWKKTAAYTPQTSNCVATGGVGKPTCSPLPGEMGLGGYYGHYQGHWMSATAFLYNTTGNMTVKKAADRNVAILADVMEAWKAKYTVDGYLFPFDPIVWDKLLSGNGAGPYYSVPFYTLHKLMAGLLDQYHFAGNAQAFEMVQKMARWVHDRVEATLAAGGMELWQKVLLTEWGGMNDVLFNLYEHTGNEMHLKTARCVSCLRASHVLGAASALNDQITPLRVLCCVRSAASTGLSSPRGSRRARTISLCCPFHMQTFIW